LLGNNAPSPEYDSDNDIIFEPVDDSDVEEIEENKNESFNSDDFLPTLEGIELLDDNDLKK
jgi:hypothetical protein